MVRVEVTFKVSTHIYIWMAWINPRDWCWRDLFHMSQSSPTIISSIESDFSARCETSVELHQAGLALLHLPTWWWILFNVRQGVSGLSWYHMLWWNQFSISFYDLQASHTTTTVCWNQLQTLKGTLQTTYQDQIWCRYGFLVSSSHMIEFSR